jgi:nucleotide-binding universal stress UspA family protein
MKFLIAIGSKEYSGPTLKLGMRVARAFGADVTIAYVGEKISSFSTSEVLMAQENLDNWEVNRRGVDVLEWAYEILKDQKYIEVEKLDEGIGENSLVQTDDDRCEVFLKGTQSDEVKLILRNGEIISQLRGEVSRSEIDVTIIGGSQKRRMAHNLIQYIDSSIFVVNKYDLNQKYKILIAVDDSPNTRKAVKYGTRVSQSFNVPVEMITVSKKDEFGDGYTSAANWAKKFLRRSNISFGHQFLVGEPAQVIYEVAGDNHIIVMGSSTQNPLLKFFKGSKPLNVMETCKCPILIVK